MNFKVSSLMTNSRRVCAVLFESTDVRLLCICVYIMPYKSDALLNLSFNCLLLIRYWSSILIVMFWLAGTLMLISPAIGLIPGF